MVQGPKIGIGIAKVRYNIIYNNMLHENKVGFSIEYPEDSLVLEADKYNFI